MICLAGYDLCKSYRDSNQTLNVLQQATLEVQEAELVCITGQSGSGKSTLLHLLGLLDSPDSGQVMIGGKYIGSNTPEAASIRNLEMGFVFQFHYLIEDLNAQENVALPMIISGVSSSRAIKKAAALLKGRTYHSLSQSIKRRRTTTRCSCQSFNQQPQNSSGG